MQTNVIIASATALVSGVAGADAVAGYGTDHLEYLLELHRVLGWARRWWRWSAPISAPDDTSARSASDCAAERSLAITEAIGLATALWPRAWLELFGAIAVLIGAGRSTISASSGRSCISAWVLLSISPRRAPAASAGRCSPRAAADGGGDRRRL